VLFVSFVVNLVLFVAAIRTRFNHKEHKGHKERMKEPLKLQGATEGGIFVSRRGTERFNIIIPISISFSVSPCLCGERPAVLTTKYYDSSSDRQWIRARRIKMVVSYQLVHVFKARHKSCKPKAHAFPAGPSYHAINSGAGSFSLLSLQALSWGGRVS
jgi:hypothetical protein